MATIVAGQPLGIIAGRGRLPAEVARAASASGRKVFVLALEGQAEPEYIAPFDHAWVRLGDGGKALRLLRDAGTKDLVLAGGVTRPSLWSLRPDARTARFLTRVGWRAMGDDSLLSAIVREFEAEGFRVIGADTVWQDARMPPGQAGRVAPDEDAWADIHRGVEVALALGRADVGQSVVVQQGIVLAVEAVEGTDAMLARAGELRRPGPGGVLVKLCKPGQEQRVDLPAVGPETVVSAHRAGLRGIAVQSGSALLLDRAAVTARADAAGIFVEGIDPERLTVAAKAEIRR